MAILVTGGAGYIGSHTVRYLQEQGREVVVYDNLSTGHLQAVNGPAVIGDIFDGDLLIETMKKYKVEAVIHFAAFSLVGESMTRPGKYYNNNIGGTLSLLEAMRKAEVGKIVFSSTAATFGEPVYTPIDEQHPQQPTNVYGRTKLYMENMLRDYDNAYGIKSIALRYFNACGAHKSGEIGEDHKPESHLVPIIMQSILGLRGPVTVFGNDYNTPDGTCIRDYIHVTDLAQAHVLAVDRLLCGGKSDAFNLGNGNGFSVLDIINAAQRATGRTVEYNIGPRRAGDPAILIAGSQKAKRLLGWKPEHDDINDILTDAWRWHSLHKNGF